MMYVNASMHFPFPQLFFFFNGLLPSGIFKSHSQHLFFLVIGIAGDSTLIMNV